MTSSETLIPTSSFKFSQNLTFDLHDIIGILLNERLLSEPRFGRANLFEISDGAWPASCIPLEYQSTFMGRPSPKVGYFVRSLSQEITDPALIVRPDNFLHEDMRTMRELDTEEVESIFWRVRNHDSSFFLHHALQLVLDYLPASTALRMRTPGGLVMTCAPQSFAVAEMGVLPRRTTYINHIQPRRTKNGPIQVQLDQYTFGERHLHVPWVYLIFGKDEDLVPDRGNGKCIAVDVNSLTLGLRGLGGEPFVMERRNVYHDVPKMLPRVVDEDLELIQSARIFATSEKKAKPAVELAIRVLARLEKITRGEKFCAYCGETAPKAQCSRCRGKSRYCGSSCQRKAWSYHKLWCKIDAAATELITKPDTDAEMRS